MQRKKNKREGPGEPGEAQPTAGPKQKKRPRPPCRPCLFFLSFFFKRTPCVCLCARVSVYIYLYMEIDICVSFCPGPPPCFFPNHHREFFFCFRWEAPARHLPSGSRLIFARPPFFFLSSHTRALPVVVFCDLFLVALFCLEIFVASKFARKQKHTAEKRTGSRNTTILCALRSAIFPIGARIHVESGTKNGGHSALSA